jgi:hypothetical protein
MSNPKASPLEAVFNLEPESTPVFDDNFETAENERASQLVDPTTGDIVERSSSPTLPEIEKEERLEDLHIDSQLENIHSSAIVAFEKSSRIAQETDPKFAARNAEVAAQYLTIALNAVNSRVDAKFKRQKVRQTEREAGTPGTVNNTVIVADRNTILDQIFNRDSNGVTNIIEAEK